MFVRIKKVGTYQYLQIVETSRHQGKVRQRVLATLGRADDIQRDGTLDGLLYSLGRFSARTLSLVVGKSQPQTEARKIGPVLVFERLWHNAGLPQVFGDLLRERNHKFSVERALFLTVLHRICCGGSDRDAEIWRQGYQIEGMAKLKLHHIYRAMASVQ